MDPRDWRAAWLLFAVISTVYFATIAGITSSNDGSHFALVRAIVDNRSFEISDYLEFTENQDYALRGDLRFSDRPPGTALLAAPLYALSALLPGPLAPLASKHDPQNPRVMYAVLLSVLAAGATAVLLFWMLRGHWRLTLRASVLATLAFAFGTMTWKYGSLLYSHAASGLMVMAAVALMLRAREQDDFWIGLLLGGGVLMEYTNVVFAAIAGVWWLTRRFAPQERSARKPPRRAALFVVGALIPAAFLLWYNTANFGGPLTLSTFSVDTTRWPQNASFFHDFATPLWVGLPAMLFYGSDNQGLFWLAPVSLLGLAGVRGLWQRSRREFVLIVGGFAAMLLLFSASTTFNPYTNDGRYLTPFLGLWFVAVGFGVERLAGASPVPVPGQPQGSPLRWAIVYGLLFWSVRNQLMHIALSWGHDFQWAVLRPLSLAPENVAAVWRAVFPNAANVPLWWGMLAIGWWIIRWSSLWFNECGEGDV